MQINTGRIVALMRRNGMDAEANAIENGEAVLGTVCEIAGFTQQPQQTAMLQRGNCAIPGLPGIPGANMPGIPGLGGNYPACYTACQQVNPCLRPYLEDQALRIDAWSLLELYKNEAEIVHLNTSVGVAPFNSATPIASNQSMLFTQEIGQQLAWIPGLLKVSATFSDGADHQSLLNLELFAGPRGLTSLTDTTGLIRIGRAYTFEDFVCGASCYLAPWPKLFNCTNPVIPGERAVYVKVVAGALPGGATVTGLSIVAIKADTQQFVNCCGKMNN